MRCGECPDACVSDCPDGCYCDDVCVEGPPQDPSCGSCQADVCAADAYCCNFRWDRVCVDKAIAICGVVCGP